jgi:hypothetical protein
MDHLIEQAARLEKRVYTMWCMHAYPQTDLSRRLARMQRRAYRRYLRRLASVDPHHVDVWHYEMNNNVRIVPF